jgi:hypothetical protein
MLVFGVHDFLRVRWRGLAGLAGVRAWAVGCLLWAGWAVFSNGPLILISCFANNNVHNRDIDDIL